MTTFYAYILGATTVLFFLLWWAERSARQRWQETARRMIRLLAAACDREDDWRER